MKLASSANATQHVAWANQLVANSTATNATSAAVYSHALTGYSVELDDDKVTQLLASPDVDWVEEDGIMHTMGTQ